jgi:hypothetical protein
LTDWIGLDGKGVVDILVLLEEKGFAMVLVLLIGNGYDAADGNGTVVDFVGNRAEEDWGKGEDMVVIFGLELDIDCSIIFGKEVVDGAAGDTVDSLFFVDAAPAADDVDDENGDVFGLAGTEKLASGNDVLDDCLIVMVASLGTPNDDDDGDDDFIGVTAASLNETPNGCLLLVVVVTFLDDAIELFVDLVVIIFVLFEELLPIKDVYKELIVLLVLVVV